MKDMELLSQCTAILNKDLPALVSTSMHKLASFPWPSSASEAIPLLPLLGLAATTYAWQHEM